MRFSTCCVSLFLACILTSALVAQKPRPSQLIDTAVNVAEGIAIDCDEDCSAIIYRDSVDETVWATVSDGRGKTWSAPVRIDDDTTAAAKFSEKDSVRVSGDNIYAAWRDERNSIDDDVYFTVSKDKGLTWAANVLIPKGFPAGANPVRDFAMDADGDVVALLISTENAATGDEELYFACSTDCGTTFTAAIAATTHNGGGTDIDNIDMEVEGNKIHMTWRDNSMSPPMNDVFYSAYDCAAGAFVVQDSHVSANMNAAIGDAPAQVELSVCDGVVGIVFLVEDINGTNEEVWVNVTNDCGASWCGDAQVGSYTLGTDDCDNPEILVNNGSCPTLVVTWEDNRSGSDEIYAISGDLSSGCPSYPPADSQISNNGGGFPRVAGKDDYVAIAWSSGAFPNSADTACSRDAGRTFGSDFTASDNTGDVDFAEVAYCSRYCNFVMAWLSDDNGQNDVYAGGYRCPVVCPVGVFKPNQPASFEVSGFGKSDANKKFAVLVSLAEGNFLLPDGRNTCLAVDNVLNQTIALAQQCSPVVTGTISAAGTGTTLPAPLPATFPPGTKLYFVAVSFNPNPLRICCLTDVNCVVVDC